MSTFIGEVDCGTPEGLGQLRQMFSQEYQTLALIKDDLLAAAEGQYVAIQGDRYEVRPTLEDAERAAHRNFENRLYFLGKIDPVSFKRYLSEW